MRPPLNTATRSESTRASCMRHPRLRDGVALQAISGRSGDALAAAEHFHGSDRCAVRFDAFDQAPLAGSSFPPVVVIAQSMERQLWATAGQVQVMHIRAAGCMITTDVDQDVSEQMLCGATDVEETANELNDGSPALNRTCAQVAGGVVGDDLGQLCPVTLVHRAGKSDQRPFDFTFVA